MKDSQWKLVLDTVAGNPRQGLEAAFIIDSPWLPNWHGVNIVDYFASEQIWLEAHEHALREFPNVTFLPGFWSEFGMCTEPSAFGARARFPINEFPFAEPVIRDVSDIDRLPDPEPESDGLLPFVLARLRHAAPRIEALGHKIRFSVSRGPMNIASFLMGTTEFLLLLRTDPDVAHALLNKINELLKRWHLLQREALPTIDGIFVLDDLVGFVGEADFLEFGLPYLRDLFDAPVSVKFFHNDADCRASVKHYPAAGINLYNPGSHLSVAQILERTEGRLAVLGGIPPRDVLADGSPEDVRKAVEQVVAETPERNQWLPSCNGGMPPGVTTENLRAFLDALDQG